MTVKNAMKGLRVLFMRSFIIHIDEKIKATHVPISP